VNDAARARVDVPGAVESSLLYPVRGVSATIQEELRSQLEAAMAFADYCVFLTDGAEGAQAARLADGAEALYDATMDALRRHGTPA
jgi:predicted GTPase